MRRYERLAAHYLKYIEVHLVIVQPDRYLGDFAQAGADLIIVHQEAGVHLDRAIEQNKQLGKRAGVAICPATPVQVLDNVLEALDLVLVMTVNSGFGGQEFIPYTLRKVESVRTMLNACNPMSPLNHVALRVSEAILGAAIAVVTSLLTLRLLRQREKVDRSTQESRNCLPVIPAFAGMTGGG